MTAGAACRRSMQSAPGSMHIKRLASRSDVIARPRPPPKATAGRETFFGASRVIFGILRRNFIERHGPHRRGPRLMLSPRFANNNMRGHDELSADSQNRSAETAGGSRLQTT